MIFRHLMRARREAGRVVKAAEKPIGQRELGLLRQRIRGKGRPEFRDRKVVILGAGIAGLACALELSRLGFAVVVLEAEREHIGGRVRTHRRKAEGRQLHAELGAMRIPRKHLLTNHYIDEFKLQTRPFVLWNEDAFIHVRKHAFRLREVMQDEGRTMHLFRLTSAEKELKYEGLWNKAVLDVLGSLNPEQVLQLYADELSDPTVVGLDHKTLATALHDAHLSREASEYVMTMMGLETALPIALTEHLREENDEVWQGEFHELVDGTDTLATAFHERIPAKIRRGSEVFRLEQPEGGKARVFYRDADGQPECEEGDWLICTIPLGVLNRLDISSAFSDRRLRAIQGVNYDPSSKVIGHAPYRWWERNDGIYGGGSQFDTQMGSTWYPSDNISKDNRVTNAESLFLASYTWGQLARRIAAIPDNQLDDIVRHELARIHPYIAEKANLYTTEIRWAWDQIPTQAGAYAFFLPGEQYRFYQDLVGPDGRVFLTGEHVSHTHSWIQGALESAIHTMVQIVEFEERVA